MNRAHFTNHDDRDAFERQDDRDDFVDEVAAATYQNDLDEVEAIRQQVDFLMLSIEQGTAPEDSAKADLKSLDAELDAMGLREAVAVQDTIRDFIARRARSAAIREAACRHSRSVVDFYAEGGAA